MNQPTSTLSPQHALQRLLQADKTAKTEVRQAEDQAEQRLKEAQEEAALLIEKARSQAEAEAGEIIKQRQAEAPAQTDAWLKKQVAATDKPQGYLADVEAMRQQAEHNLEETVTLLVAWVTGEEG